MQRLQEQRERQQAQRDRLTRRKQLDQGLRLKMKRLSREQQDELQLDMSVLQTLLQQEVDERRDAAVRKVKGSEVIYTHMTTGVRAIPLCINTSRIN